MPSQRASVENVPIWWHHADGLMQERSNSRALAMELRFSCINPWWRHQMETFSALLAFCAGNSPVTGEFSAQRQVTRSFDVFFDLRQNPKLSKQWRRWWFETLSRPLWRHCNAVCAYHIFKINKSFYLSHALQYFYWSINPDNTVLIDIILLFVNNKRVKELN